MLKSIKLQKGFTIVELLIVIVVIGILAALVLNTFAGAQARARDTQRQTDVDSLSKQLEVYFADAGRYPALTEIDTVAEAQALLKTIDPEALKAPQDTFASADATSLQSTAPTDSRKYQYVATPASCTTACTAFTITYVKESGGGTVADRTVTKKSLSQ